MVTEITITRVRKVAKQSKLPKDISDTLKAYAAGFTDGEGYIGIRPSSQRKHGSEGHMLVVTLVNHDKRPIEMLLNYFGGLVYNRKMKPPSKPQFEYQVTGKNACAFLVNISPFLLSKQEQAEVAIEWWRGKNHKNLGGMRLPMEEERNNKYYLRMRELNHRGI